MRRAPTILRSIEHLKFIQDIETLGYIACVIEMNRRGECL